MCYVDKWLWYIDDDPEDFEVEDLMIEYKDEIEKVREEKKAEKEFYSVSDTDFYYASVNDKQLQRLLEMNIPFEIESKSGNPSGNNMIKFAPQFLEQVDKLTFDESLINL